MFANKEIRDKLRRQRESLKRQKREERERKKRHKKHKKLKEKYKKSHSRRQESKIHHRKRKPRRPFWNKIKRQYSKTVSRIRKKGFPFIWAIRGLKKQNETAKNRDRIFLDWYDFLSIIWRTILTKKYFWRLPQSESSIFKQWPVKKTCTPRECFPALAFNSLGAFVLSFFLFFWLHQFYSLLAAKLYGLNMVFYNTFSIYSLRTISSEWSGVNIVFISAFAPIMIFLTGAGMRNYYLNTYFRGNFARLFFAWAFVHSLLFSLGSYLVGALTNTGFVYAIKWMFMSDLYSPQVISIFLVFSLILIMAGRQIPSLFYIASPCSTIIRTHNRDAFLGLVMLFPWIAGFSGILILNYPRLPAAFWLYGAIMGLILIPAYINRIPKSAEMVTKPNYCRHGMQTRFFWLLMGIALWIASRFYFYYGIEI